MGKEKITRLSLMWILSCVQEVKEASPGDLEDSVFKESRGQGLG